MNSNEKAVYFFYTDDKATWKHCYERCCDTWLDGIPGTMHTSGHTPDFENCTYTVVRHSVELADLDGRRLYYVAVLEKPDDAS